MKKLVILLLFMNSSLFAGSIYCPPSLLLCSFGECDTVPEDFYISSSYMLNMQYVFLRATVIKGVSSQCMYVNRFDQLFLTSKKPLLPNQSVVTHQWYNLVSPIMGDLYACEFDVLACPFLADSQMVNK